MDFTKFTIKSQEVLQKAQNITEQKQQQVIEPGHILQAIFEVDQDVTPFLLNKLNVNVDNLQKALEAIISSYPKVNGGQQYLSTNSRKLLQSALKEAEKLNDEFVSIEIILYSLIESNDTIGELLKDNKVNKKI